MHIGAFTPAGTWRAAIAELPALAALGVTILEVMPIGDFPGASGATTASTCSRRPACWDAGRRLRAFVNAAHAHGLAVILDVVYNHLGTDRQCPPGLRRRLLHRRLRDRLGQAAELRPARLRGARTFVISNARYWIDEFHFDGLRIDATQNIYDFDDSHEHILAAVTLRARVAGGRRVVIIAENEPQDVRLLRSPADGGFGMDAMWNDDFHHAATVALTGRRRRITGLSRQSAGIRVGRQVRFLYQRQARKEARGRRPSLPPAAFVNFLQNHDQIANSGLGQRVHKQTSPGKLRAMTAYTLLRSARRCCSWARSSRRRRRSSTSPTIRRTWPTRWMRTKGSWQ